MAKRKDGYYHKEARRTVRDGSSARAGALVVGGLDVLMFVVTILSGLALLGGLFAKVLPPRAGALFVFAGLFYQIIYLVNMLSAAWWALRWKKWFFISGAMLLLGAGNVGLFYRSDISTKRPEINRERDDVVVASYNVMTFASMSDPDVGAELDSVTTWINTHSAGIVCLQESHFTERDNFEKFKEGLSKLRYGFFVNSTTSRANSSTGSGFAVLSAYPIVRHGISDADENRINAVWADVKVGRDTVRVFNTHLQSTGITQEDSRTTLSTHIIEETERGDKLLGVARKMYGNYKRRSVEANHISSQIKGSKYPVIVCGDFNDTPVSYTYRKMKTRRLEDAFVECGRGVEYTYTGLYKLFRIDYILSDKEYFTVKSYDSFNLDISDHKALVVRLGRNTQQVQ